MSSIIKKYFSFTGTASVARAYSGYIDSLIDKRMATAFRTFMPIDISFLSPYPDFCAFVITLSLTLILCIGVKESTRFNNIFTCLNICVVVFVTFCGWITADFNNWRLEPTEKYVVIFYQILPSVISKWIHAQISFLYWVTPPRTPRISGLKSQILKPSFLS